VLALEEMLAAIRHLEAAVLGANGLGGVVLRYGGFYGPGTSLGKGGIHLAAVRGRKFRIVGRLRNLVLPTSTMLRPRLLRQSSAARRASITSSTTIRLLWRSGYQCLRPASAPATSPCAGVAGAAPRWRADGCHDDPGAWRVECQS
jgi:hypothetical protein